MPGGTNLQLWHLKRVLCCSAWSGLAQLQREVLQAKADASIREVEQRNRQAAMEKRAQVCVPLDED